MKFIEYMSFYKPKINDAIALIYNRNLKEVKNSFLKVYYSELRDYFLAGGKRIRPLLCIATFNAFSEKQSDDIIFPSVGVEFLHNASLIHDDIIDKDNFRRGKPAFHYRFRQFHTENNLKKIAAEDYGNSIGIIGGDSAFLLGLKAFFFNNFDNSINFRAIQYYEQAFREIANGVLIEIDIINKKNLKMEDYIHMVSLKTGALLEKSILIGANYAKVEEKYKSYLSIYGKNLGIIFQIIDDILGTFGDETTTGKPTDGDIRESKKTCLLIEANNMLKGNDKIRLNELIESINMTQDEVQEVRELFLKAEVIDRSKKLADTYYQEAQTALEKLKPVIHNSELEFYENLLKFVLERKF